jgi:hypothetical protein
MLGTAMGRDSALSQLSIAATSILGLEALVTTGVLVLPTIVHRVTVTPMVWVDESASKDGTWRARGWAEILGLLPEPMSLIIWCSTTESVEPLAVMTEGDFVFEVVADQVVPVLRRLLPDGEIEINPLRIAGHDDSGLV